MPQQIVEISTEGRRLSLRRGFLLVAGPEGPVGEVPLDDIEAVIAATPAITWSNQLLAALAERGVPVIICSSRYTPSSCLFPMNGHHAQGERFEAQAAAGLPLKKRLWAQLVKAKIAAQGAVLQRCGKPAAQMQLLQRRVRSGDPDNIEATAAQRYWPELFGRSFRRDRGADDANILLNYGYTVLRAATARAIAGAGLHPSLGLHHKSGGDAFRLADDLMEPFRPTVDLLVFEMAGEATAATLDTDRKRRLAAILNADFATETGVTTLSTALSRAAQSLAQVFLGDARQLALPLTPIPLPAAAVQSTDEEAAE